MKEGGWCVCGGGGVHEIKGSVEGVVKVHYRYLNMREALQERGGGRGTGGGGGCRMYFGRGTVVILDG